MRLFIRLLGVESMNRIASTLKGGKFAKALCWWQKQQSMAKDKRVTYDERK